jgi:hypothetical protein
MMRRRAIASEVSPDSLEPNAHRALQNLGYQIVPARTPSETADPSIQPELRIVDEEGFDQITGESDSPAPIVFLMRGAAPPPADQRIVASLTRPVRFEDLYAAIQEALEPTPRRHPRVTTALAARCAYDHETCAAAVISISQGGCLLRSPDGPPAAPEITLQFQLPRTGLVSTRARQVNRRGSDLGLAFEDLPSESRAAVSQYVMDRLIES